MTTVGLLAAYPDWPDCEHHESEVACLEVLLRVTIEVQVVVQVAPCSLLPPIILDGHAQKGFENARGGAWHKQKRNEQRERQNASQA
eukprot:7067134-Prymnesium_polylepis.2